MDEDSGASAVRRKEGAPIDLVMLVRQVGFQEAVSFLGSIGAQIPEQAQRERQPALVSSSSENPSFNGSDEKLFKPHAWLPERGLSAEKPKRYEAG